MRAEVDPDRPFATWSPVLAAALLVALGGVATGVPLELARRQAEARLQVLSLDFNEQRRAARALAEALRAEEPSGNTTREARIAQLDSLGAPPDGEPAFPALWVSGCLLGFLMIAGGLWVYRRWATPLAALVHRTPPTEAWGAPPVAQALLRRRAERALDALRAEQEAARWRAGLAAIPDGTGQGLDEDVRVEVVEAQNRIRAARESMSSDLSRVRSALKASRKTSGEVSVALRPMAGAWTRIADRARRAEIALANVGPELEARHVREQQRVQRFRTAAESLSAGLVQGLEAVDDLSQQALRATDAAAREEAMRAHVGRGGQARPVPAPPLDEWAADLQKTALQLEQCLQRAKDVDQLEALDWSELQGEALQSTLDCAGTVSEALEHVLPVLRALGRWVDTHEADLAQSAQRLLAADGGKPPSLEGDLADVDAAVEAARTRVEAAVRRAERLMQATGA